MQNHTVIAIVTMKERESMFSDTLRDATGSLMTILGYVSKQSRGQLCLYHRQSA